MPTAKAMKTPQGLSRASAKFWRQVTKDFVLEPHHLTLLSEACHCLDRIAQAKTAIARDGLLTEDRFGQLKEHPAVEIELKNKRLFRTLLRELGLDVATPDEGYTRPPRLDSGRPRTRGG